MIVARIGEWHQSLAKVKALLGSVSLFSNTERVVSDEKMSAGLVKKKKKIAKGSNEDSEN